MFDWIGVWLSLVERLLWEQDVVGSNPAAPTTKKGCTKCALFCGFGKLMRNHENVGSTTSERRMKRRRWTKRMSACATQAERRVIPLPRPAARRQRSVWFAPQKIRHLYNLFFSSFQKAVQADCCFLLLVLFIRYILFYLYSERAEFCRGII